MTRSPLALPPADRPSGFSLIEMMVAFALSGMVLALVMGVFAKTVRDQKAEMVRAELVREGAFAGKILSDALRMSGFGVPKSAQVNGRGDVYHGVLVALADKVGIVADLPRPHSNYSTYGLLGPHAPGDRLKVMWMNENSGMCHPGTCTTSSSTFFRGDAALCTASVADRTCPWALGRVGPGDWITITSGTGLWSFGEVDSPLSTTSVAGNIFLNLNAEFDYDAVALNWPNTAGNPPVGVRGVGFVSTPDRVFFEKQGTDLVRKQCWGAPEPLHAEWPPATSNAMPANPETVDTNRNDCTAWEVILRNVDSVVFNYFLDDGSAVPPADIPGTTGKDEIARVEWLITLKKTVVSQDVYHYVIGTAGFRN